MKKFIRVFLGLLTVTLSLSCTRAGTQKASFQLQLPSDLGAHKVGSMTISPSDLNHLIINVTGPGISTPVYFSWDSHDGSNTPPSTFTLDVPQGSSRLVQVLAVYRDGGNKAFFYGDIAGLSTTGASNTATVNVSLISNSLGEGQIAGRYLTSANRGPTGKIITKYTPAGRPAMLIETSEIYGGYFRVFALQGAQFNYTLEDGTDLFGGAVDVDLNNDAGLQEYATQVNMAPFWSEEDDSTRMEVEQSHLTFGWFASAANNSLLTGKSICYTDPGSASSLEIQRAYLSDTGPDTLEWGTDTLIATGDWQDNALTEDPTDLLCADSGDRYSDYLSIDHTALNSHDSVLALRGPYVLRLQDINGWREGFSVHYGSAGLKLEWEYLPGTVTDGAYKALDGTDIYWRARVSEEGGWDEEYRNDGYDCPKLGNYGFQLLHSESATPGNLAESNTLAALPAGFGNAFNEGRVDLVMCPYSTNALSAKTYYRGGMSFHSYSGGSRATEMELVKLSGDPGTTLHAYNGTCTPFLLRGKDGYIPDRSMLWFDYVNSEIEASDDADCPVAATDGSWLTPFADGYLLFIKSTTSDTASYTFNIEDSLSEIATLSVTVNFDDMGTIAEQGLVLAPTAIKSYGCYPVTVLNRDTNNGSTILPVPSTTTRDYSWTSLVSGNFEFYGDSNCTGATLPYPNNVIYSGQAISTTLYFKYTGPSANLNLTPTLGSGAATSFQGVIVTATPPGAAKKFSLQFPENIGGGNTCTPFYVKLQDQNGNSAPATATYSIGIPITAAGVATFYTPASGYCGCSGGDEMLGPISVAAGSTTQMLCYSSSGSNHEEGIAITTTINGVQISGSTSFWVGNP